MLREMDVLSLGAWEIHPLPVLSSKGKENPTLILGREKPQSATPPPPSPGWKAVEKQLMWGLGIVLSGLLSICTHLFSLEILGMLLQRYL